MKKYAIIALVLVMALGLCACRMGKNDETTPPTDNVTEPPANTTPEPTVIDPTIVDPTIMDPTIEPNVPDESVDNDHLVDPTDGSNGNGMTDGTVK